MTNWGGIQMGKYYTIDLGDGSSNIPNALEQATKLGQTLAKLKAQEEKFARIAQQIVPPSNGIKIDPESIRRSVEDLKIEPIISEEYLEQSQEYQRQSLEELRAINENTAQLKVIVELIHQGNEKQDALIALTGEILSIAKAKSKAEADTLLKKVLGKITGTVDAGEFLLTLTKWAMSIYTMVQPLLPQ